MTDSCPSRRALLRSLFFGLQPVKPGRTLVCVFLRGGADGLNMIVPHGDDRYYTLRPTLGVPRPDDRTADDGRAIDLDRFYGLHPALAPLRPIYSAGRLAIVHAAGSDDQTRSHFEAQDQMEHGVRMNQIASGGWLGRHLRARNAAEERAMPPVALGTSIPESLRGAPAAATLTSLDDFSINTATGDLRGLAEALEALYSADSTAAAACGRETLEVMRRVERLKHGADAPAHSASYPDHEFARGLRLVARLIQAGVGPEAACLDLGGWDTHFTQGAVSGLLPGLMRTLAESLAAFDADLGDSGERVVTVVMTEFGRRAYENVSFGTDHGRAGVMFLMGGSVAGGKVYGAWPGLGEDRMDGPGDLAVTTDYRDVLAEVVARGFGQSRLGDVFPGHTPSFRGVMR
ncbi:MAG: DUF1501 domain-containing protein [Planctomycetes bacterium]|nr:DUF1501 domain-containing protein [Planctomycetota bacterium]